MNVEHKKNPTWIMKTLFFLLIGGTLLGMAVGGGILWFFSRDLPKVNTKYNPLTVTRILANNGKEDSLIGEFYKEKRYIIPTDKIPELVIQAFISAEDDRFFEHSGINLSSIIRAGIANFKAGHVVQGGSTITQQVAKSLVLTSERSFVRKIKEVIVASQIEKNLNKQQILYLYLNQIYLGHGAYGVQAAAQTYFRKDISQISLPEAALLGGLPQAPGKYSPLLNPKKAKERQIYVLRRMMENGKISPSEMAEAVNTPLKIYHDEDLNNKFSGYLVEHIRRYLLEKYGEKAVYEDGLVVSIPTNKELMKVAHKSLVDGLRAIDKRIGWRGPIEKLKTQEEIEKKSNVLRSEMIEDKVHYQMLMPDSTLDYVEATQREGYKNDIDLIKAGEIHKAIVTKVDDKKKIVHLQIASVAGEMPLEQMRWARPPKDEANPNPQEPKVPSQAINKGDVVYVKILEVKEKNFTAALEQEPQIQGAVFSVEAQTGNVLALEGGYDFNQSEFNRAIQAQRQPGSAFKPIIYSVALERGYTPASIIIDSPIVYEDTLSGKWKPSNFEEKFYGDTTFRQALIKSRNVPTIKIVQAIQISRVIEYAKRLGMMNTQFPPDLSISLGSATCSLVDLTKVYSLFPRLGRKLTPIFVSKVVDREGRVLEEATPQPMRYYTPPTPMASATEPALPTPTSSPSPGMNPLAGIDAYPPPEDPDQVLDPRIAYVMTHLMKEVIHYGTGHDAKGLGRPLAGKTGTTNEYIDAWFMGFTPYVVTGVWVGFDGQKSIGHNETGAKAALPIWLSFMKEAIKEYPDTDFSIPPGVTFASIDPATGKLAPPNASNSIKEAFIEGTEPQETAEISNDNKINSETDYFKEDL